MLKKSRKLLGLPNLELALLFGKILSFIAPLSDFLMLTEAAHLLRVHLLPWTYGENDTQIAKGSGGGVSVTQTISTP